jgi:hypothetical protein
MLSRSDWTWSLSFVNDAFPCGQGKPVPGTEPTNQTDQTHNHYIRASAEKNILAWYCHSATLILARLNASCPV